MQQQNARCIAVDWSGARDVPTQQKTIWLAIAEEGNLIRLLNGQTRDEVVDMLLEQIGPSEVVAIGLDFAFSFPQWYLAHRQLGGPRALWDLAEQEGEQWLDGDVCPFWGRNGALYQHRPGNLGVIFPEFRQTDLDQVGFNPQSVFKIAGRGHVGTGTIRGFHSLVRFQCAGMAIWPFDAPQPGVPTVVEIYPRLFYGVVLQNNWSLASRNLRRNFLEENYNNLEGHWRDIMVGNPNAFDAGVSALQMSNNANALNQLQQAAGPPYSLEGRIWH